MSTPKYTIKDFKKDYNMKMKIVTTYSQITPESASRGDFSDTGWYDKKGITFESVQDTILFLKHSGTYEASSSEFHPGVWYSTNSQTIDYTDSTEESLSFHLKGFTINEQKQVYEALFNN